MKSVTDRLADALRCLLNDWQAYRDIPRRTSDGLQDQAVKALEAYRRERGETEVEPESPEEVRPMAERHKWGVYCMNRASIEQGMGSEYTRIVGAELLRVVAERNRYQVAVSKLQQRLSRLDAMLASEECPQGLVEALNGVYGARARTVQQAAWCWFRETFGPSSETKPGGGEAVGPFDTPLGPQSAESVGAEVTERDAWRESFEQVALALNCLPSSFPDANGHVLAAVADLKALAARHTAWIKENGHQTGCLKGDQRIPSGECDEILAGRKPMPPTEPCTCGYDELVGNPDDEAAPLPEDVQGEPEGAESERLRAAAFNFLSEVVTIRQSNTIEWMAYIAQAVNTFAEALGDKDRVRFNGDGLTIIRAAAEGRQP